MTNSTEPPDDHVYDWVSFSPTTFQVMLEGTRLYKRLLDADLEAVSSDPDLKAILDQESIQGLPLSRELRSVEWHLAKLEKHLEDSGPDAWGYDFSLSHRSVRFYKSVGMLYLQHLNDRRNALAARDGISRSVLDAVDQQLATMTEKLNIGVFEPATPTTLSISQLPIAAPSAVLSDTPKVMRPAPVLVDSIEIRDEQLRARCLDLMVQFDSDGTHDRLDTVVSEATRVLEDRLRHLSGARDELVGVDLAKFAFAPPDHQIVLSDITAEQEAAHLLFRGVFGFVRNSVHHRLVSDLQPQRVLQVLGMIDYLIFLTESGTRRSS